MVNRCDSVDALMYAYCEFMRIKEENQMLEKNKDYVEFILRCTSVERGRDESHREVGFNGYSNADFPCVPMDVVCKEFDHKVIVISKRTFDRLQAENEELKKKLQVPDPFAEYKELFEKLRSKEDVEKFEWTLNHICGGQASANGWMITAKLWRRNYETLSKLVGFSSTEEIQDYLTNEAECDTLQEAISRLSDEVERSWDGWASANNKNNSWKAAAECNSPKELIEKIEGLEGKVKVLETEAEVYSRALKDWKEGTGCPSPSAAKTMIESGMFWRHAYNEIKEVNKKLADSIKAWQNVTGDATPEDYLASMIKNTAKTVLSWQEITGFSTPEKCSSYIDTLEKKLEDIKDLIEED